jgi:hypothetical protein
VTGPVEIKAELSADKSFGLVKKFFLNLKTRISWKNVIN